MKTFKELFMFFLLAIFLVSLSIVLISALIGLILFCQKLPTHDCWMTCFYASMFATIFLIVAAIKTRND